MTTIDWAGEGARRWAAVADRLERQLEPVSDLLFASSWLRTGERVLDVGCGRGTTTRRAAREVGPDASVVGLDIAPGLIEEATAIPHEGAPIDWIVGDAQVHPLPGPPFDVVISRFGTLFFEDPVAAFSNFATGARTGARLRIAVWQPRDRSPIFQVPLDVAAATAARHGVGLELLEPDSGPLAFGKPDFMRGVLERGGWTGVQIDPYVLHLYLGGPGTVEDASVVAGTMGAVAQALAEAPAEVTEAVRTDLAAAFVPFHDGTGVKLEGAVAIVSATRPGT